MFWILIVCLLMTPFVYFKNYNSYNMLSALSLFAILFVVGTIILCCILMDTNDDSVPKNVDWFHVV